MLVDVIVPNASTKGALKFAELGYKVKELIWRKRDGYIISLSSNPRIEQSSIDCGCEG